MEYKVQIFNPSSSEWKNNVLLINEKDFNIKNENKIDEEEEKNFYSYSLINATLIDNNYEKSMEDSFLIGSSTYNIYIKPLNKEDKPKIISDLRKIIKNNFLNDEKIIIDNKNDNLDEVYEFITKKISALQNLLLETKKIIELNNDNNLERSDNNKMNNIKININKIETQLDLMIINLFNYHDSLIKMQKFDYSLEEETISSIINGDNITNNFEILNSYKYHQNDLNEISNPTKNNLINNSIYEDKLSYQNSKPKNIDIKNNENEFFNKNYDTNKIRKNLKKPLSFPPNIIKEIVTNFTQNKALPVYFNEPLSMGQKQCEKFYYLDLLKKAANEEKKEMQLCYISAFIIGEIFLNIGRSLKPFNPIIGETYEYYNNNLNFRYYSEQVSHKPPVNAYVGETPDFILYGDTLGDTSFKIFKGGMELSFNNKIHILFKKSGDHYTYIPPNAIAKGLMKPPLYVDYYGDVLIQNINNPAYKCELKFIEESWAPNSLGNFEGTIYNNDKITYLLGGNWKNNIYMTDPDGNNKKDLLILDQKLNYLNNTSECYYLPEFTCDLNNMTEELENSLPLNDSRFKKDIRFLEEGNIDEAQKYKEKYEEKQRKELNNDKHKILFFKEEYNSETEKNYYVPNDQYWEMKKNNTLKDNLNANIFDVSNY